jgi:hypothetical protein
MCWDPCLGLADFIWVDKVEEVHPLQEVPDGDALPLWHDGLSTQGGVSEFSDPDPSDWFSSWIRIPIRIQQQWKLTKKDFFLFDFYVIEFLLIV